MTFKVATTSTLFFLLASTAFSMEDDLGLTVLGTPDLSKLGHQTVASVNSICHYEVTTTYSHLRSFPEGNPEACKPGEIAPEDNMPYLAPRMMWESLPAYIQEATGMDHISIDWNP